MHGNENADEGSRRIEDASRGRMSELSAPTARDDGTATRQAETEASLQLRHRYAYDTAQYTGSSTAVIRLTSVLPASA
jgi:hypothetical protein